MFVYISMFRTHVMGINVGVKVLSVVPIVVVGYCFLSAY